MTARLGAFLAPLLLLLLLVGPSAWAKVELTVPESVEVYLGGTAHIPCQYSFIEVEVPSFYMIQWFVRQPGGRSRQRIFYTDGTQHAADSETDYTGRINVTSDGEHLTRLTVGGVRLSDGRDFFCQVNGLAAGTQEGRSDLRVYAPPEGPLIEGVQTGISITNERPSKIASCEVRNGYPKPNITWYRDGVQLTSTPGEVNMLTLATRDSSGLHSVQSTLEYKVLKEDKDARFSCEASFFVPGDNRTAESNSINITVHYPTTMVELWKESPQGLVKEGDTVELRCQGDGNPPPPFIFTREQDDVELQRGGGVLLLREVTRKDSGIYQCRPLGADAHSDVKGEMQLTVHYLDPAVVVPKDTEMMLKGEELVASCNALSSLKTSTVWYKDGQRVGSGTTLHLRNATYETAGEYQCEVTVPHLPALRTSGSVHIIVEGGPQLVGMEQEVQLREATGRTVNLSCEVLGHPPPSISWSIVGSQNWQEVVSKADEYVRQSVVSVKVTSDISALCNASNARGSDVKAFSIKAIPTVTLSAPFSPVEGSGVIIVGIILCLLLVAILGSVLYFLRRKGKIPCGRSGKQEITKERTTMDDIVVEMKTDAKPEGTVLLKAINGDKASPGGQ